MNLLLPKDRGLIQSIVPVQPRENEPRGLSIFTDLRKSSGRAVMNEHEKMKIVKGLRYKLFDDVCDHLRKTPEELTRMDPGDLAVAFVEVSRRRGKPLDINKFPPDKLQRRTAEYLAFKKHG